jgi:hypothetical protein
LAHVLVFSSLRKNVMKPNLAFLIPLTPILEELFFSFRIGTIGVRNKNGRSLSINDAMIRDMTNK